MSQISRIIICPHCKQKFEETIQVDIDELDYTEEHEDLTLDLD